MFFRGRALDYEEPGGILHNDSMLCLAMNFVLPDGHFTTGPHYAQWTKVKWGWDLFKPPVTTLTPCTDDSPCSSLESQLGTMYWWLTCSFFICSPHWWRQPHVEGHTCGKAYHPQRVRNHFFPFFQTLRSVQSPFFFPNSYHCLVYV